MAFWFYYNYPKTAAKLTRATLIFLFISLLVGYLINISSNKFTDTQISNLQGHLTTLEFGDNATPNSVCLLMRLQEYPQTNFIFQDKYCRGLDKEGFKNSVSIGDIVALEISKKSMDIEARDIDILNLSLKGDVFLSQEKTDEAFREDNLLMTILSIASIVILLLYAVLDLTGIIDKIKQWLSKTQSSIVTSTERPTSRDFNEFGD